MRATGRGRLTPAPVTVPLLATARRVTGVGDVAGGILANLRVEGLLRVTAQRLTGERLALSSDKLRGLGSLTVDLRNGVYLVQVTAGMQRYEIPGFGQIDALSELRAVPGPAAAARRSPARPAAGCGGWTIASSPGCRAGCRGSNRADPRPRRHRPLRQFAHLAPKIALVANGFRRRDGTYSFESAGRHADYGPLRSARTAGSSGRGWRCGSSGRSTRSAFATCCSPRAERRRLRLARRGRLDAGAVHRQRRDPAAVRTAGDDPGRGAQRLRDPRQRRAADPGGFTGRLDVDGGGLAGRLLFSPLGQNQRIAVNLTANDARFVGPPPIVMGRGTIEGVVVLDPAGTSVEGRVVARGVSRGPLSIASLDPGLRGGVGQVRARIAGSRGRDFAFNAVADVAPGRYRITGSGTLDRRPLELTSPAVLTRTDEGWRLAPTRFTFAGGNASLAGLFGERTEVDARLEAMPLTVLDMAWPRSASAASRRAWSATVRPRPRAAGRRGQSAHPRPHPRRPGAVVASGRHRRQRPARRGQCGDARGGGERRADDRPRPGADLADRRRGQPVDRLMRAPMAAQVRYNGAADTLWRLTGIELIDLSGPAAIGADLRGSLENPSSTARCAPPARGWRAR